MRTSLNNIKAIDDYLLGCMDPGDVILFEANILLNNDLIKEIQHQQSAYEIIRQYSRQKLKDEIIAVQEKLVAAPQYQGYMQRITNLFK